MAPPPLVARSRPSVLCSSVAACPTPISDEDPVGRVPPTGRRLAEPRPARVRIGDGPDVACPSAVTVAAAPIEAPGRDRRPTNRATIANSTPTAQMTALVATAALSASCAAAAPLANVHSQ